jgi:hypothetical protein
MLKLQDSKLRLTQLKRLLSDKLNNKLNYLLKRGHKRKKRLLG